MATRELTPEVLAFLAEMRVPGILSTLAPSGQPITSAVWFGIDDGAIVVATPGTRNKARNARNDPRVSFVVDTKIRPYKGVAVEGVATIDEDASIEVMYAIARRYLGDDLPDWVHERYANGARVLLRIAPTRVRPWNIEPQP